LSLSFIFTLSILDTLNRKAVRTSF